MRALLESFDVLKCTMATVAGEFAVVDQCKIKGIAFVGVGMFRRKIWHYDRLGVAFVTNCYDSVNGEF